MTRSIAAVAIGGVLLAACAGGVDPDRPDTGGGGAAEQMTPEEHTDGPDAGSDDGAGEGTGTDPVDPDADGSASGARGEDQAGASGLQRDGVTASSSLTTSGGVEAPPLDKRAFELFTDLDATASDAGAIVEVEGDVLFDFDDDRLRTAARPVIADLVELAGRTDDVPIQVVGHTDGVGTDTYNLGLSQRRAEAVVAALVEQGVDAGRLDASGVGSTEPLVDEVGPDGEDDPAARARNRRVEVTFEGIDLEGPGE